MEIYIKKIVFRFYDISLHSKSTFQDSNGQLAFLITKDFMFMSFVDQTLTLSKAIKDKHICYIYSLKQRNRLLRNIQPARQVNQDQSRFMYLPPTASISSKKIIQAFLFLAISNSSRTILAP